jgi:septal ring factor EnvC (AmiA/AmiB activator)
MNINKLFALLIFLFLSTSAFAQSSSQLRSKKEALQREIELLQRNLNKTATSRKLTLAEIRAINAKIALMQNKIGVINSEIKNLDGQIHENTNMVLSLRDQLALLKKEYASMIRFAQRNRNSYDKMMFIFASEGFNQAYKRVKYLQQFSKYRMKQANYIQGTEQNLNVKLADLDKSLKQKSELLKEQETERQKLGKNKSAQAAVLNQYKKEERRFAGDIAARKRQQASLDRAIRAAILKDIEDARRKAEAEELAAAAKAKAENREAPVTTTKTNAEYLNATPRAAKLSADFEGNRGSLPWPLDLGAITEHFGIHTVGQAKYDQTGIKIATQEGASVQAVFNGKVSRIIPSMGTYTLLISHGEYRTIYQNVRNPTVKEGEAVTTRQQIGSVATKDGVTELDFQIWRVVTPLNPEAWILRR